MNQFSLRFKDGRTEAEFARSSRATLLDSLFMVGSFAFVIGLCRLAFEWLLVDNSDAAYPELRIDKFVIPTMVMVCSMALAIFSKSGFAKVAPALAAEVAVDVYIITLMTLATFFQPQTMSGLRGHVAAGCSEDTALVLCLLGAVLAANILLPVRWHLSIPTQLAAIINYVNHAFVVGGPSCQDLEHVVVHGHSRVGILLALALLIGVASKAKRISEIQARELFIHVISEKTRRVESEFQLDQLHRSEAATLSRRQGTTASEPDSVPATTTTARVFEVDTESGVDANQLTKIAELGREEHWLIEPAELEWVPEQILGVGAFAILVPGTYLGKRVAVKVPKASPKATQSKNPVVGLCNELKILRNLVHPHIVSFYGACVDVQFTDIALVTELVDGLPLLEFVKKQPSHMDKARILREVSGALCYLHAQSPRVVHGDLKDSNILVQHGCSDASCWGAAKLLDFGLARQITKRARPMGGSIRWMAPEVVLSGVPDMPSDVFSFGRVAFFTLTGVYPAGGKTPGEILMHLESGLPPPLLWPPTDAFSVKYQDIIHQCGMANSTMRPGISQVQQTCTILWRECAGGEDHVCRRFHQDLHAELQAVRRTASLREAGSEL